MDRSLKIRVKLGNSEVEYEGPESFVQKGLSDCVDAVIDRLSIQSATFCAQESFRGSKERGIDPSSHLRKEFTTNQIAIAMGASTGPELVIAAAIRLGICLGKESFTRSEILDEMKTAGSVFRPTLSNNLGASLQSLIKSHRLNRTSDSAYALTAREHSQLLSRFEPE